MNRLKKQFILLGVLSICRLLLAAGEPGWVIAWGGFGSGVATGVSSNYQAVGTLAIGGQTLTNIVSVAAGGSHGLALRMDGTVVGWGWDFYGQATVPVGLTNVVSIAAGENLSMALKLDGTVSVWGENEDSWQTNIDKYINIAAISAGGRRSVAALTSGGTIAGESFHSTELSNIIAVTAEMTDRGYILYIRA